MDNSTLIFCGSSEDFLAKELAAQSTAENGGIAFRKPSLINANGTLIAVADRASSGEGWGYIELAVRRSVDGGKTWTPVKAIASPPARETRANASSYASAFYVDPCLALAPNGDVIMLVNFWPECKGPHNQQLLDRKKIPYAMCEGEMCPLIYDREGGFYYVLESGDVLDNHKNPTDYTVRGLGELYRRGEYMGNIYLNGAMGKNEFGAKTTFGAPLKAPKRGYVFMLKSTNNGVTWSEPKDVTSMLLAETDGAYVGVTAGTGITTKDGRIVIPLYSEKGQSFSVFSIDGGESWHRMIRNPYCENSGEWQLVEAPDGTLLGLGTQRKYGKTPVSYSANGAKSWLKAKPTALFAPRCQKSVLQLGDYVLCSHPSGSDRENGVISVGKLRRVNGRFMHIDWFRDIVVNEGFFGYSCLAKLDSETVGVLYESQPSSYIEFKSFKLDF